MIIKGPDGFAADVDSSNRLMVASVSQDIAQSLNLEGKVFTGYFTVTPLADNDYFLYIENTGSQDIALGSIEISSTVPTEILYEIVTGTPVFVTGTGVPMVNHNLGSSAPLLADIQFDTNITGLVSAGIFDFEECSIADTKFTLDLSSGIIIPQGKAVAFKRVEATGLLTCTISVGEFS